LNLRPHPETKIARVPTGSAAPRAELGRACCPILIARGGPGHGGLISYRGLSAVRTAVPAPMWSGLVKGREGSALLEGCGLVGFSCRQWRPGRSRGKVERPLDERPCRRQGPASDHGTRRPGQRFGEGSHAPIRARRWVRMTVSPDCSVRSTAVSQAHAETRARPVLAFSSGFCWVSSWMRMWKERASSRRAMATVAMFLPRRRASSA
jgi:hypothetical protein